MAGILTCKGLAIIIMLMLALTPLACCKADNNGANEGKSAEALGQLKQGETELSELTAPTEIIVKKKDSIQGAVDSASEGDQIVLKNGVWNENVVLDDSIDITGKSADKSVVEGTGDGSVFTIGSDADVILSDMTITGGSAAYGGGIYNEGSLILNDVSVTDNTATEFGGGVFNIGTDAELIVIGSTISDNSAYYSGGGVYNEGTTTIVDSTISGNSAEEGYGGGVYNRGTATITDSTISDNSAFSGAGVEHRGTSTTITDSTISGNSADYGGGGIFASDTGAVTVTGSTISGNSAEYEGGGVYNEGGVDLTVADSTITGNSAEGNGGGLYNGGTTTIENDCGISLNIADSDANGAGTGGGIFEETGSTLEFQDQNGDPITDPAVIDTIVDDNHLQSVDGTENNIAP